MPYRLFGIWAAILFIAGLVILIACLILRRDPQTEIAKGYSFKRKALAYSLLLLTSIGVVSSQGCITCYMPAESPKQRYDRTKSNINEQISILEKLLDSKTLQPEVIEKSAGTLRENLWIFTEYCEKTPEDQMLIDRGRYLLDKANEAVIPQRTVFAEINTTFVDARKMAKTAGDESMEQREAMQKRIAGTKKHIGVLAKKGELTKEKAELLCGLLDDIANDIYSTPPADDRSSCYLMAYNPPVKRSYDQLEKRLDVIDGLIANGLISPSVRKVIIVNLEDDYKTLSDEEAVQRFLSHDKDIDEEHLIEIRDRCKIAIDELKQMN